MKRLQFSDASGTKTQLVVRIEDDGSALVSILSSGADSRVVTALDVHQVKRLRDALIVETA